MYGLPTNCIHFYRLINYLEFSSLQVCLSSYIEMRCDEFKLGEALKVVMNQVMSLSRDRQVELKNDVPNETSSMYLYGDILRLQQVLSDFLASAILFTPANEGSSVGLKLVPRKECIGTQMHVLHVEFR